MSKKQTEATEASADPGVVVLRKLDFEEIEEIICATAAMTKFRKLALAHSGRVALHAQGALVHVPAEVYAGSTDNHAAGDVKVPAHERRVVTLTMFSPDFAAEATWYERLVTRKGEKVMSFVFTSARIGGPRAGANAFYKQPTILNEEITRCLSL